MPVVVCLCGRRIEAIDAESLATAFWAHTDEEHKDIRVSEARREDVTRSLLRTGGWDGTQQQLQPPVEIRRLSPERKDDYLAFFDGPALADNPVWASCYCLSYELDLPGGQFDDRSGPENRAEKATRIEQGASTGVLAYADGRVVGWCHAAPRTGLPLLDQVPEFACDEPAITGNIVCFVIAPQYRGQGLSPTLLEGACAMLRDRGMRWVEVYPPKAAMTAAASYHGRPEMYRRAGFEEIRGAGRHVVMRRAL